MSREICPDCGGTTMDGDSNCTCDEAHRRAAADQLSQEGQRQGDYNCSTTIQRTREEVERIEKQRDDAIKFLEDKKARYNYQIRELHKELQEMYCKWDIADHQLRLAEKVVEAARGLRLSDPHSWEEAVKVCAAFDKALEEYDKGKETKDDEDSD